MCERAATHRAVEGGHRGNVVVGEHGAYPVERGGRLGLDRGDGSARVGAADERGMQHAGHHHVVDVAAAPGEQPRVLAPRDALTDEPRRFDARCHIHGGEPTDAGATARRSDRRIGRAPAFLHASVVARTLAFQPRSPLDRPLRWRTGGGAGGNARNRAAALPAGGRRRDARRPPRPHPPHPLDRRHRRRRLVARHQPRVPPGARRLLARRVRLAGPGAPAERAPPRLGRRRRRPARALRTARRRRARPAPPRAPARMAGFVRGDVQGRADARRPGCPRR